MPADNERLYAAHVLKKLEVLIVDGRHEGRRMQRASAFFHLALDPEGFLRAAPAEGEPAADDAQRFVRVTVADALRIAEIDDFSVFQAIVLADVPQLPSQAADRLAAFVANGGGLLIAPGDRARPAFYNAWRGTDDKPLLPATLKEQRTATAEPAAIALAR